MRRHPLPSPRRHRSRHRSQSRCRVRPCRCSRARSWGRDAAVAVGARLKSASPTGSGISARPLKARRCLAWVTASLAHAAHSVRCSSSRRLSLRDSRSSSRRDIASSALWHVTTFSSSSASDRRARNSSVSSADVVSPSRLRRSPGMTSPSSSRITSASRCDGGMRCRARTRPSSSSTSSSSVTSGTSLTSSTSAGRAAAWRHRWRTMLCAITSSQFPAFRGSSPRSSARSAFTNVVCVTSSASAWLPSTA